MTAVGASNLSGERISFFERGMLPKSSGIAEGYVVVHTSDSGDNLIVDLPTAATALLGGRAFAGISASANTTTVSSNTLPSDNQISVQMAGVAKCQLKANTACVRGSWAAYDPADGGLIVPWTSASQVPIGTFTQSKSSSASAQMVGVWLQKTCGIGEILLGAIISSSTAVTDTTSETAFDQAVTVPANLLSAGAVLRIRGKVRVTSGNGTDTLTLRLRIGGLTGVLLATAPAFDVTNGGGDLGVLDSVVTVREIGASGSITAASGAGLGVPGTATWRVDGTVGAQSIDTTAAKDVVVTAQWSAASASNSCLLEDLTVSLARISS